MEVWECVYGDNAVQKEIPLKTIEEVIGRKPNNERNNSVTDKNAPRTPKLKFKKLNIVV